jgi:hypothetical protein
MARDMSENGNITKEIFEEQQRDIEASLPFGGVSLVQFLAGAGETIPAWWSGARDMSLRNFWKEGDHISGTVNTIRDMMVAIPNKVIPRDTTIKAHIKQADEFTRIILEDTVSRSSLVGRGWGSGFGPFVEDYSTQDNGAWMVVDGPGNANQPVIGSATRLIHLDSGRVWRTGSQEFPIIFTDFDGKRHTIHHSRVINLTSMPSPIIEMYGVGFCALSRAIQTAQNLIDISNYKLEKLGSRPLRAIATIENGGMREAKALQNTFAKADVSMDNLGLRRFSKMPIFASKGTLSLLDLASLPDGFNELESVQLGMSVLALAFGVDVRQLAFAIGVAGQTKADAEVQHLKMRGKGPGLIIQEFEREINSKFLPPYLKLVFDWQDDAQDEMVAKIQETRSKTRKANLETAVTTVRVEREQMVKNNELTQQQFVELELDEGRLSDGTDVLALFESTDRKMIELLDLGVNDPRDIEANDPAIILPEIKAAIADVEQLILRNRDIARSKQALAALIALENLYKGPGEIEPLQLNASQARGIREILADLKAGETSEGNAIALIVGVGIPRSQAEEMVRLAQGGETTTEVLEEVTEDEVDLEEAVKTIVKSINRKPAINVNVPRQNIEVNVPRQEPPIVNIPKQEVPKIEVVLPESTIAKQLAPRIDFNPEIIVEMPEMETEIIRDNQGLVKKTIRRKKKNANSQD